MDSSPHGHFLPALPFKNIALQKMSQGQIIRLMRPLNIPRKDFRPNFTAQHFKAAF
jgi:hypothetical protein